MDIYIDRGKIFQPFYGFGASGAWWAQEVGGWEQTDTSGGMSVRDKISQLLFSRDKGIGLRIYRYNLGGGSRLSGKGNIKNPLRRTESFEISAGRYDFSRDKNAVYMMKQAVKDGADEVIFFVNSPIERLTANGMAHCDKLKICKSNLKPKNYVPFAKYCLDVTEHFVNEDVPVKYISPVNEPLWTWTGGQEGCHYTPSSVGRLFHVFTEELDKRPTLKDVKLSGPENGDIRWFNKSYTKSLLKFDNVVKKIDSIDVHSYFLKPVPLSIFSRTAYLKRYRRWLDKHYPNVEVKTTEWCHMKSERDKGMDSALVMANIIYEDISILNVTSWQHWIAVSEVDYCDGLIYIHLEDKSYEMTKRYYATGNFSKYIPYGARRIDARCKDRDLKLLAFVKDGKCTVIVINDTAGEKTVTVPIPVGGEITVAVTDSENDLAAYKTKNADIKISAKSVTTIIF